MSFLKDISHFKNTKDYLPILNGCINANLLFIFFVYHNIFRSVLFKNWYKTFRLSAAIFDILTLFLIILLVRLIYYYIFKVYDIWIFAALAFFFHVINDLIYYIIFIKSPVNYHFMFDFFKQYTRELNLTSLIHSASISILAVFLSAYFKSFNLNINLITLIMSCYFTPIMVNYI